MDWPAIDRYLMGEAWTGSRIAGHAAVLCEQIGPRWSSSPQEAEAIRYIQGQMADAGLDRVEAQPFDLRTWSFSKAEALTSDGRAVDCVPFNRCPSCSLDAPLVDVGYGTPREIEAARDHRGLGGAIAVLNKCCEPFTRPIPHAVRLDQLAAAGAAAVLMFDDKRGRRAEYHNAGDWRFPEAAEPPLPAVTTSSEHGAWLGRLAASGRGLRLVIESRHHAARSANVVAHLEGALWRDEHLLLGGHHDTVMDVPGGNDNASGTIAVMETARLLAGLRRELGVAPGRGIRFVTFAAEEQLFQGSLAYIARHQEQEPPPRLAINLDELSTGRIKGVVLAFPHLRDLLQDQLDGMGDGLRCQVMAQLDAGSDHFPFARKGIDAAHLWRWRFVGVHPDANYHHEEADTADKINVRELKEYVGQLARLLLRLSHQPPAAWPDNPVTEDAVRSRLEKERGTVVPGA